MSIINENEALKKERQLNQLVSLVEKQIRTRRHLEEYAQHSIAQENIELAKKRNQLRQEEINQLKNILIYGNNITNHYKDNTEKRFLYTEGYLNHNADHMNDEVFKNTKAKQENRKLQLDQWK